MRVLFLPDGDAHEPSSRLRVYNLAPCLAALGIASEVLPPALRRGGAGRARVLHAARRADVVVLQRILPPRPLLALLRRARPALVFDFDDALYALTPAARPRLQEVLEASVEVVAGSEELARYARLVARSVTVVPTVVDPGAYSQGRPRAGGPLRVGWIGMPGNVGSLELVRSSLRELVRRGRELELRVISSAAPEWPELPVASVPWQLRTAPAALAALDVGLAPLADTPLGRGKCGLKAIEYMASWLPVVASPVGALAEIVVEGETGFLARAPGDWVERLERLAADEHLRRRLGVAGRQRVAERYSLAAAAPALAAVLERAAARALKRSA